jgi:hypothetical protein
MARSDQERLPPEPRLQSAPGFAEELGKALPKENESGGGNSKQNTASAPVGKDPLWEIKVLRNQWDDVLKNGPTDASGKRYGMPIEQAKQEVLKQLEPNNQRIANERAMNGDYTFSMKTTDQKQKVQSPRGTQ